MDERGLFIVFEGLDGAGTSTQIELLKGWLERRGVAVEMTKEPSSGPVGSVIRLAIDERLKVDPHCLALAFAADRSDHIRNPVNGVEAALRRGRWVLSDRYVLSSMAYQASEGIEVEWLAEINRTAPAPDVTIFVDTDAAECMRRINARSSALELFHDEQKLRQVLANYRRAMKAGDFVGHLIEVGGDRSKEEVGAAIRSALQEYLDARAAAHAEALRG